jgi:hypothetical protein
MGKRSAVVELFLGDMGSIQRELRPSTQREDQLTMETKLEQIAVKAVNQLPKSVVREIRTPRSVGTGGGRPPPVTRWEEPKGSPLSRFCDRAAQCQFVAHRVISLRSGILSAIGAKRTSTELHQSISIYDDALWFVLTRRV